MAVDGSLAWDFLVAFFASRRAFLSIFRRYEHRVMRFARDAGVHREDLMLPPQDLARLFRTKRLAHLRDVRLAALRRFAHGLFREAGVVEPLDTVSSHIFHEASILLEEHQSVVRFQHFEDPRRYAQLFEEVSGYYPARLRRIRKLFADGLRRLEELLPEWGKDRVVVRSAYLFGGRVLRGVWDEGALEGFYARMYPAGGAAEGFLEAGKSFLGGGFAREARAALERAVASSRPSRPPPRRGKSHVAACADQARKLLKTLPAPAEPAPAAPRPPRP